MAGKIFGWSSFVLVTGMFVYMVIAAVGNLTQLPAMGAQLGLSINSTGWLWLWLGVALPIVAYLVALLVGRRRSGSSKLLILVTALALTGAFQLEILLLVPQSGFFS